MAVKHTFLTSALYEGEWWPSCPSYFTHIEKGPQYVEEGAGWASEPVWTL